MASQRRPGPNSRDSSVVGLMAKLKRIRTTRMKTTVVVRSSRERNSVRSSLPRRVAVLERRLMRRESAASEGKDRTERGAGVGVGHDGTGVQLDRARGEGRDLRLAVEAHHHGAPGAVNLTNRPGEPGNA